MHFSAILLSLAALSLALPTPQSPLDAPSGQFMTCPGVQPGSLTLEYIIISPNPFVAGQTASLHAVGNSTANITSGANVTLTLNIGGIFPVYQHTIDLCQTLQQYENATCPIQAGLRNITLSGQIPASTPAAEYLVKVNAVNGDGSNLICVEGPITVQSGGGSTTSPPSPPPPPGAPVGGSNSTNSTTPGPSGGSNSTNSTTPGPSGGSNSTM
ncbi:Phosphatidylglycerol/phosphatidylinositol transfer protein [Geranomyces variabilis]|uniref:Phosphatidylglycerol/phosphatidylinositol transfer protein n=1 Tax=Geranomyces variabilis TaxID=109894 RepID=A0AAD5TN46_9FUNG|nr:Phosphatidylglycerol/phosphatidylinositol transfer protein [Geranomyces variabilis]